MLKLGGVAGDLTWNTRTKGDRWAAAGLRGDNRVVPWRDGAVWRPGKKLEELSLSISTWIVGADANGGMPSTTPGRRLVHERYERLLHTFRGQLGELVDTDTGRRAWAELDGATNPTTMAGGTRAEVDLDLTIPAGCWTDLDPFTVAPTYVSNSSSITVPGAGGSPLPVVDSVLTLTGPGRNVRITEPSGAWLQFDGDLPAGTLTVDCGAFTAYASGAPTVNLIPRLRWSAAAMLPILARSADPALAVTMQMSSSATRLGITGRRRWYTA